MICARRFALLHDYAFSSAEQWQRPMTLPEIPRHPTRVARPPTQPAAMATCRSGTSTTSIPAWTRRRCKIDLARADSDVAGLREPLQGQARRDRRRPRWRASASPRRSRAFEALEELLGRIMSYAGLLHAGDTTDPERAKFYGDVQEKITIGQRASSLLRARAQPHRRRGARSGAWPIPALGHYRPWIEDIRKEKPYQLEDRVEQLFHEKSVTGRGAWNRLFDETMASLRFKVDGEELALEPTLNLLQDAGRDEAARGGRRARGDVQGRTSASSRHITNTLAKDKEISDRWRGFKDVAAARHLVQPRRAGGGRRAGRGGARRLSAPVAPLLRAEGALVRPRQPQPLGPQRAAAQRADAGRSAATRRAHTVLGAYGRFAPEMADDRQALLRQALDRCAGRARARRPAPSPIRRCRARTPMCCSTTRASCAT